MCGGPNQPRSAAEPTTGRGLIIYIYLIIYIDISSSLRARMVPVPISRSLRARMVLDRSGRIRSSF